MTRNCEPWCNERVVRDAVVDTLLALRVETGTPWVVLDPLRHTAHHNRPNPQLTTLTQAAATMGLDLSTRAGWLNFAERVALRLPEST